MTTRTVSVELQAKVAGFVSGMQTAGKETAGLNKELEELGRHDRELRDLEEKTAGLTASTLLAAKAADELGAQVADAGDEIGGAGLKAHFLADELAKARREAAELQAVLRMGGGDADLLKQWRSASGRVTRLESAAKRLGVEGGDGKGGDLFTAVGEGAGKSFVAGFSDVLAGSGGLGAIVGGSALLLAPVLAPAVLLAGAEIGGILGGGIVMGLGTAGVGAGIAAAFRDPQVQAAGRDLLGSLHALVGDATAEFASPTVAGLHILRNEVDQLRPSLRETEKALSPLVTTLAAGAADGVGRLVDHLNRALVNSSPLVEQFADELPKVLDQVGGLLENMSEHSREAEFALDILFGVIKTGIGILEVFADVGAAVLWPFEQLSTGISKLTGVGRVYDGLSHSLRTLGDATQAEAVSQVDLKAALDASTRSFERQLNQMLASDSAAIDYQQGIDDLTASVRKNGRSLDINTQAGRNNKRTLDQLVGSMEQTYEANIASGMGADKASLAFLQQEGALKRQMEALHLSKAVINDYISRLDAMRYAAIAANNAIRDTGTGYTHHEYYAQGGYRHAAVGMFIPPSDPGTTLVGEPTTGGEWLIPAKGISADRAAWLLSGAAAAHGMSLAQSRPAMPVAWSGGPATASGPSYSSTYNVYPARSNIGVEDLRQLTRVEEIRQRVGRPR
jgi:hypothetical protein